MIFSKMILKLFYFESLKLFVIMLRIKKTISILAIAYLIYVMIKRYRHT